MNTFTAHRLRFVTEVQREIELNEHQGSAIRGALFHALRDRFCAFSDEPRVQCADCTLAIRCPVAALVGTLAPDHPRGQDRPRPYTLQPPLPGSGHPIETADGRVFFRYRPGESLVFGLTLYADALALFPYVVLALRSFEEGGLGRRLQQPDGRWHRGTVSVREIWAENPLDGQCQEVLSDGEHRVHIPDIPITHAQVEDCAQATRPSAAHRAPARAALRFLTPARLVEREGLIKPDDFAFRPLFHRLITRLEDLSGHFSDSRLALDVPALLEAARAVDVVDNRLTWEELSSYSTRRHAASPLGGLVGRVTLAIPDWTPFWPWLLWGQFVHVGKDAVKGNGMYTVTAED